MFVFDLELPRKEENFNYESLPENTKQIIDKNKLTIGIDFGTTYSTASVIIDKEIINIPNDFGKLITPSYVTFIDDKKYFVGELAKLAPSFDKNTIYGIKRLIGRRYNEKYYDKCIDDIIKEQEFPFEIKKDPNSDKIKIVIEYEKGKLIEKKEFYPEQLCALILKKIKVNSEYYLSKKLGRNIIINDAVITVPAYFNQLQREAIIESAKIINLNVKRIINEPTAASLAYGYKREENEKIKTILVIDFGGGTLDITILNFSKNEDGIFFDINSSNGHSNLGGDDFDLELMKYCLKQYNLGSNLVKNLSKNFRLKRACEKAKIKLSSDIETNIQLENYQNLFDLQIPITRDKFNEISSKLFKDFEKMLDQILNDYKASGYISKISKILLVGGTTYMPKVKEIIKEKLPNINIEQNDIDNLHLVSNGAAILGAKESGLINSKKINLFDTVNLPLGVEEIGGKMEAIIKKNQKLKFQEKKRFETVADNQTKANIKIYEGEKKLTKDNFFLGNFYIKNLPEKKAGDAKIDIIFEYDENSLVKVRAIDLSNENNKEELSIEKPRLYNDAEIKIFQVEDKEMKEELYMLDYDVYKYEIIELEEKLKKFTNEENILNLINKLEDLMDKPMNLKVQISFAKYYFLKINEYLNFIEKNKININDSIFNKLEKTNNIATNIQFYDTDEDLVNNETNIQENNDYHNIVEEIFDDLIDNYKLTDKYKLYFIFTKILIINYFEKVKSFIRYIGITNSQRVNINRIEYYLEKAKKAIKKLDKKEFDEFKDKISIFKIILEDLSNLKEIAVGNTHMSRVSSEIEFKYMENSLKDLIDYNMNIPDEIKKKRIIDSYIPRADCIIIEYKEHHNHDRPKENDLKFIRNSFIFIINEFVDDRSKEKELDKFYRTKGFFDCYGFFREDVRNEIITFSNGLLGYFQEKENNDVYNKICIYLNKIIELLKYN